MNDGLRVEELLHHFRMKATEFAKKSNFDSRVITDIKREKSGISKKIAEKIVSAFPEVNRTWLLTGEGEMIKNSINQSIIGNKNVQVGNHSIVQQGINVPEENKNSDNSNSEITALCKLLAEKDKLLAEKDERIRELKEDKDKLLAEKDERIREKDERIQELKETIRELKGK